MVIAGIASPTADIAANIAIEVGTTVMVVVPAYMIAFTGHSGIGGSPPANNVDGGRYPVFPAC